MNSEGLWLQVSIIAILFVIGIIVFYFGNEVGKILIEKISINF